MALPADASTSAAPIKLTFRLSSAAGTPAPPSGTATPSPPASTAPEMEYSYSVASDAGSTVDAQKVEGSKPGPKAGVTIGKDGKEKPKRKRAPKRPAGEPGPGKSWRKGMKGNIVGVGLPGGSVQGFVAPVAASPPAGSSPAGPIPAVVSRAPFPVGAAPRTTNAFLPPMPLDISSPKPRQWTKKANEFKSITGMKLEFKTWIGDDHSAYASSRAPPPPPPEPERGSAEPESKSSSHPPTSSVSLSQSAASAALAAHSFIPRSHSPLALGTPPPLVPAMPPSSSSSASSATAGNGTSDPKAAAAAAAAHFRGSKKMKEMKSGGASRERSTSEGVGSGAGSMSPVKMEAQSEDVEMGGV